MTQRKDKISDALDMKPMDPEKEQLPSAVDDAANVMSGYMPPVHSDIKNKEQYERDYEYARENLYNIIERGSDALNNIVELAAQSQHPRSYEVVADLVRTLSQTNKDLLDINKKVKDLSPKDVQQANNIQNNVYVTADLTKLLKGNAKDFLNKETREVIDVESEDVRKRQK